MHTINGGRERRREERRFYVSNPIYPALASPRNREFLDRRSSTDRKIEGKRSSLKKKKKKKFFLSLSRDMRALLLYSTFFDIRAIKSLRGLFPSRNYCILNDFYLECDSRAFIGINHPGEGELCMDRREIRSYGISFNIFSSTNVKRIYILLLINCFVQSATACLANRAKKNIYTDRNQEKIKTPIPDNHDNPTPFTFILDSPPPSTSLSQIQGQAIKAFDSRRQPGSKVSEASSGSTCHDVVWCIVHCGSNTGRFF